MPEIDIVCPSGLSGTIRGLQGRELDLFANREELQKRRVGRRILDNCWVKTRDRGVYEEKDFHQNGNPNFDKVLQGDRLFVLLNVRIATHGPEFAFRYQCSKDTCRHPYEWTLKLDEDLPIYDFPEESLENYKAHNTFQTDLDGETVFFKLMTGDDELEVIKLYDLAPDMQATTSLMQRIIKIKGRDGSMIDDSNDIREWAQNLSFGATRDLIDLMDEVDGGVETAIEIRCPKCGNIEDIQLPLDAPEFWTPRRRKRSGKRKVRQRSRG